jgi:hypothetical protein
MLYSSTALNRVVDVHMNVLDTTQQIQEKMYGVTGQIALLQRLTYVVWMHGTTAKNSQGTIAKNSRSCSCTDHMYSAACLGHQVDTIY